MRLLVVHRERAHASLVSSALKRLGHRATPCDPAEAVAQAASGEFDGVIADGRSLGGAYDELRDTEIPLALSGEPTAGAPAQDPAQTILPRVWTVADLRRVLESLSRAQRPLALGSSPAIEFDLDDTPPDEVGLDPPTAPIVRSAGGADGPDVVEVITDVETSALPPSDAPEPIAIVCGRWADAERLCRELEAGRARITVRSGLPLVGERIDLRLRLPDELVLSIAGRVVSSRALADGPVATKIEIDLSPTRLRGLLPSSI